MSAGTSRRGGRRAVFALLAAGTGIALLAGCGIRPTAYPVDAGAPASRALCKRSAGTDRASAQPPSRLSRGAAPSAPSAPASSASPSGASPSPSAPSEAREVFLVCGDQLRTVTRQVGDAANWRRDPQYGADELLELLGPGHVEQDAPISTSVPEGLRAARPRKGDASGAIRLSTAPEKLSRWALAQVVCTFAVNLGPAADTSRPVQLGGPTGEIGTYRCADVEGSLLDH